MAQHLCIGTQRVSQRHNAKGASQLRPGPRPLLRCRPKEKKKDKWHNIYVLELRGLARGTRHGGPLRGLARGTRGASQLLRPGPLL